jgi:polyisoprenoid-binding protein YceI
MGGSTKSVSTNGSWQVDARHSDAKLTTDGTTDYGKTKIDVALGYARVNGDVKFDDADPTKSSVDLHIYPATSMMPAIEEDGNFKNRWLADLANHTLICFHSKGVVKTPDGRLQTTGTLKLTRVDRNVEAAPTEAYAGPVYGAPMIHTVTREVTFAFDAPTAEGKSAKSNLIRISGSTNLSREGFPQLLKAVVSTYWPPVVQDENCQAPAGVGEAYSGAQCTGTFLETPALPPAPRAANNEDLGTASNFNTVAGNHLTIQVQLHLRPRGAGEPAASGD